MAGPFEAAGAVREPTRFSALSMQGEQFTGLWTQAGPYRDAATAYLIRKFYQGNRIDRIIDGLNREIYNDLTDGRRPGLSVYNSNNFPGAVSFYPFKSVNWQGQEVLRVLLDGIDQSIYDATAGQKSTLMAKTTSQPARFLGQGTSLYIADGVDQKKWIFPGGWQAATNVPPGTLINVGAEPGNVQMALGGITVPIVGTLQQGSGLDIYINPENVPDQFANMEGVLVTFSGLTGATFLNGTTKAVHIISSTLGIFSVAHVASSGAFIPDTGQGTTGNGTTGGSVPAFSSTGYGITADAGQQWKCYGSAIENWGLPAPLNAPVLTPINGTRYWQANTALSQWYAILDSNQNLEVAMSTVAGGSYITGMSYPAKWNTSLSQFGGYHATNPIIYGGPTQDGQVTWQSWGQVGSWQANTPFRTADYPIMAILDSNLNLQIATVPAGNSGATVPAWATAIGATTTDGSITWTCVGPGVVLTTASIQYAYSTQAIDGSVSTSSPAATIQGPILGAVFSAGVSEFITIAGAFTQDPQLAAIWIWRTPQGQSTLILEDQIPIDYLAGTFGYDEYGIPDTSTNGGGALNALIAAPIAEQNDPPPLGLTGMAWDLQRVWGFVGNTVYCSGGPDTLVGNGNTAWPPLNSFPFLGAVVKLRPVLVQNGGIIVYTTSGMQIILGTGTASNPFYVKSYCDKINLANYNAEDIYGSLLYLMEANGKVAQITIEYPFNPQSGYAEVGFPIGDQFLKVTTGGNNSALFDPATAFLSWNVANTRDTGMYVATAVGWFRMSMVQPPESGLIWSPFAETAVQSGAVQSVETAPGIYSLLVGPSVNGPILMRDTTGAVFTDNGTAYPSWDAKGVILLCATGQETHIEWISTKSLAVGSRPLVSLLMGEIAATAQTPWDVLENVGPDPANLKPSITAYCDRYNALQNGNTAKGDCALIRFDYGTQAVGDRLLEFGIYGSTGEERKQ